MSRRAQNGTGSAARDASKDRPAPAPSVSPYLVVEDVAERLHCSTRTVHELTRTNAIPHRRLPGLRRCLFRLDELEAWEKGSPLQVTKLAHGGRLVVPRPATA